MAAYGQHMPQRIRGDDLPDPARRSHDLGGGCWALIDERGAYWDGSKHISGLPMTTILEERAYRFPSAELASAANIGANFIPVRIYIAD